MTQNILELATITLASGSTEEELLAASKTFQTEFLDHQSGFIRRDMIRRGDGTYLDVILWESQNHADAVLTNAQSSKAVGQYFDHMDMNPEKPEMGVEHCTLLARFSKD